MPREPIPEQLRRFILTSVPSVPFVEALLLFRNHREAALDSKFLARNLYISEGAATELVGQLHAARILKPVEPSNGTYRFAPATDELARLLETLCAYYSTHLVDVTDMIHSNRERTAKQFADAFKLRKE
jgi:hypothetical protein